MDLLHSFPIKALLTYAQTHPKEYGNIYPPLLSLVVSHLPQLFNVVNLLVEEEHLWSVGESSSIKSQQGETPLNPETFNTIIEQALERPQQVYSALQQLQSLKPIELQPYFESLIKKLLPNLLHPSVDSRLVLLFVSLWETVSVTMPWDFGLKTFNQLSAQESGLRKIELSEKDVTSDVLIMLGRMDPRVLTKPPIFRLLLQILNSYLVSSRKTLHTLSQSGLANKEEVVNLILSQDSSLVQILLEMCEDRNLPVEEQGLREEIRAIVCTFIHQLFIESPLLIKLVHFQGYDMSLIPITVHGIPSMHICLEFIPELISLPQPEKKLFGIHLAANLMEKYPIPRSLGVARSTLAQLRSCKNLSSNGSHFLTKALSSLTKVCTAFPFLIEEIVELLLEVTPNESSIAGQSSEKLTSLSNEIVNVYQTLIRQVVTKSS
eukprot:TRINITY_DN2154_c0_g1_i1.p1 TRINITY_DN2154_c0_g1~~TRINITY_DN2154_c0_g1_i1.p1  ORF type:complete len:435 (+),score=105.99 TRINITY_DN2154_c0_g1_i1:63-1367(+)